MKTSILHLVRSLSLVLLIALPIAHASAQIEVAPTRVLLSMRDHSQEVSVMNPSDNSVEVSTELGFRVIRCDSLGALSLDSARTAEESEKSGRDWLKIFPRRFTLPPHGSRLVRVMVTVPNEAKEGEYWGRLIVTGTPIGATIPVDGDSTQGIDTKLTMRMQLDLPVIIRKGEISTGIEIRGVETKHVGDTTVALVDLNRTGNSAYRGTLAAALRNSSGNEVVRSEQQFTAEFGLRLGVRLPVLADGDYTLDLEARSVKKGGANDAVIPAPTVARHYHLVQSGATTTLTAVE